MAPRAGSRNVSAVKSLHVRSRALLRPVPFSYTLRIKSRVNVKKKTQEREEKTARVRYEHVFQGKITFCEGRSCSRRIKSIQDNGVNEKLNKYTYT